MVAVEQARRRPALHSCSQLPAEVRRVLHPGVHSLSACGRVHVGGVPGQEHAPDPVLRHLAFVAVEARHPACVVHAEVRAQRLAGDLADLVELDRGLVVDLVASVPRDDAVPAVPEGNHEGEPVADRVQREHVGRWPAEPDVGKHDRPQDRLPREGQTERPPDPAAHTVRADDVRRPHAQLLAVAAARSYVDPRVVLPKPDELRSPEDLHAELVDASEQDSLRLVLRRDQEVVEPGRQPPQVQGDAAEHSQLLDVGAGGHQVVGQTSGVELLQRARMDAEGAGDVRLLDPSLEHHDVDTCRRQVTRQQQARRPRTDNQDIGLACVHRRLLVNSC